LLAKQDDFADTLVQRSMVVSASSASHQTTMANRVFTGAIRLSKKHSSEIKVAIEQAMKHQVKGNALDLLLVALVRATIRVDAVDLIGAPFVRTDDQQIRNQTQQEIDKLSDPKLRLKMANRANDGFFSVFVLRKLSKGLTYLALKVGATPNQVTIASFALGLYAAYLFALGDFWSILAGAILLQLSIVVDCVDGEIARYTRKFSELGAWLDAISDRVKEYAVFIGLAYGAYVQHGQNLWLLAALLMTLQTFRHLSDYNFSQVAKARASEKASVPVDFTAEWDGIEKSADYDESSEPGKKSFLRLARYWIGKMVIFPIGERWLAISATAVIGGALFTFIAMPVLALISMAWVYRVRVKKTLLMPVQAIESRVVTRQFDVPFLKQSFSKRFDWLEPSLLRALELGYLIVLFQTTGNLGLAGFVVLFAIAYHHYDSLYRAMQNESKPVWLSSLGLTVPGRLALLTGSVLMGFDLTVFAVYFFLLFLVVGSVQWVLNHKTH
jgi:phosphatidylglycerophosphate synthase